MVVDSLVVVGLAVASLGTINESNGIQIYTFNVANTGNETVKLQQGYTSCGCTTIEFPTDSIINPNDTAQIALHFNPSGKGGEFYENATIVYGKSRKRFQLALEGTCITSEETLLKQFPIFINDDIRISTNTFDIGIMHFGDSKVRYIAVLHKDENNRQESIPIKITAEEKLGKGIKHIKKTIYTITKGKKIGIDINMDMLIK